MMQALITLALVLSASTLAAQGLPAELSEQLQRAQLPASAVAVYVLALDANTPTMAMNAEAPFNPASTMKLVTSYAALELLGPAYTFNTQVYATGPIAHGVLNGDLVIRGSGDPHLTSAELWSFLSELRARGVHEVHGNMVIDRSVFAAVQNDPGQFDGEPNRPYNVAPDAFLVNFNASTLTFNTDAGNHQVIDFLEPLLPGQRLDAPRYSDEPCADWREHLGADFSNPAHLTFTGSYSSRCGEKTLSVSLYPAHQYAALVLARLWSELGGRITGQIVEGTLPAGAQLLAEHRSDPLTVLLYDMNKYSNNVMARSLFLVLASEMLHGPATQEGAAQVVKSLLAQHGVDVSTLELDNGAGLSRRERISAHALAAVLSASFRSSTMPELLASLPMVGTDGTMKNRLRSDGVTGHAHIKTGSLADARAIAGIVDAASGRRYVVVCLVNDPAAERARGFQDALLNWVYDHG